MATVDEMKSRWVYSELGSPRWAAGYSQHMGDTPLLEKARLRVPFAALGADERDQLLAYAPRSARRGAMARLNNHAEYQLEHWDKDQLCATQTIQMYGSVLYPEFLAGRCKPEDLATDAREAAKTLPYYPGVWEAGIVVGGPGSYLLLDGYTRSVVFMRAAPPDARFSMWAPRL